MDTMDIATYVKFHAEPVEYLDGWWKYEDEEDNDWYVPVESKRCKLCRGTGDLYHNTDDDEDEHEDCFDCEGRGEIQKPLYHMAMTGDEHTIYRRQQWYLERRYGRRIPKRIVDYWQPA